MKPEEFLALAVPVVFILMLLIERRWPARRFPAVKGWHWVGAFSFVFAGAMNALLPEMIPGEWLAGHRLMDLTGLGVLGGAVVGHLSITLATYLWHRATHAWTPLWRAFHQLHHAPRHLNIYAANLLHPTDLVIYVLLPTLIATLVLGLEPLAAAIVGGIGAFNAFFQHWNVRTPQWMALFAQRPEAHCVHHQRGIHAYNYSDLPLWDWVFGTCQNPKEWAGETGFDAPADTRYGAMLRFEDVNQPLLGEGSMGVRR